MRAQPSESVGSSPSQQFLRQALGSNAADMRAPALLLSLALVAAVVAWLVRRRRRPAEPDDEPQGRAR